MAKRTAIVAGATGLVGKSILQGLLVRLNRVLGFPAPAMYPTVRAPWSCRLQKQKVGVILRREWLGVLSFLTVVLAFAASVHAAAVQPEMNGDLRIHDPSVIEVGGRYVAFGTGEQGLTRGAIGLKTSPDGVHWSDACGRRTASGPRS